MNKQTLKSIRSGMLWGSAAAIGISAVEWGLLTLLKQYSGEVLPWHLLAVLAFFIGSGLVVLQVKIWRSDEAAQEH